MDPGTLNLSDYIVQLRDSPLSAALVLVASLLAIPTAIVALIRWALAWRRGRLRRGMLGRFAEYIDPNARFTEAEMRIAILDILNSSGQHLSPEAAQVLRIRAGRVPPVGRVTDEDLAPAAIIAFQFGYLRDELARMFADGRF